MPRAKRGNKRLERRKKILKLAKGYRGTKSKLYRSAKESVERGATIYTDALASYNALMVHYTHEAIDHAIEYVRGAVHTNGLENFWSLFKRAIHGTYVSVDAPHLQRYVDALPRLVPGAPVNDNAKVRQRRAA